MRPFFRMMTSSATSLLYLAALQEARLLRTLHSTNDDRRNIASG
jgi:hypothetical protein